MKRPARSPTFLLEDMLLAMDRVAEYVAGLTLEMFLADPKTHDAVVRNLEIIGEAAKRLPLEVRALTPQLPWAQMYRLRNIVSHEYFGVDGKMIYRVATDHLPGNRRDVAALLVSLPPESST